MPKLFGVDIAAALAQSLGPGLLSAKLIKIRSGARSTTTPTAGLSVSRRKYPCKGMISDNVIQFLQYKNLIGQGDATLVQVGDKVIMLLGGTLPTNVAPVPGDEIYIESQTYTVVNVNRDPAAATYLCHARI